MSLRLPLAMILGATLLAGCQPPPPAAAVAVQGDTTSVVTPGGAVTVDQGMGMTTVGVPEGSTTTITTDAM